MCVKEETPYVQCISRWNASNDGKNCHHGMHRSKLYARGTVCASKKRPHTCSASRVRKNDTMEECATIKNCAMEVHYQSGMQV